MDGFENSRGQPGAPGLGRELILVFFCFLVVNGFSLYLQQGPSTPVKVPYDTRFYMAMAEQFSRGETPSTDSPWVFRPATPFLASRLYPKDLMLSFGFVNLLANAITVALLVFRIDFGFAFRRLPGIAYVLPFVSGLLAIGVIRGLVKPILEYGFLHHAAWFLFHKTVWAYFAAWMVAFGPVLFLPIYNWRASAAYLARNQPQLVYVAGIALLAWIGGHGTERFLLWGMPVVYVLIGRAIEDHGDALRSPGLLSTLALTQSVAQRLFWWLPFDAPKGSRSYMFLTDLVGTQLFTGGHAVVADFTAVGRVPGAWSCADRLAQISRAAGR